MATEKHGIFDDDLGGALMQNDTLIGIAPFALGCDGSRVSRVSIRISYFSKWIKALL